MCNFLIFTLIKTECITMNIKLIKYIKTLHFYHSLFWRSIDVDIDFYFCGTECILCRVKFHSF